MNKGSNEYKPLTRLDREVNDLARLRLREARPRPINTEETINRELSKFARDWASKCTEPLREYCRRVLLQLGRYFTTESINTVLNEALSRGLSIEAVLILLSQCNLLQCDDFLIRNYLDTGRVDVSTLQAILQSQGVTMSPEELRAIIEGQAVRKPSSNRLAWLPRFIRRAF